MSRQTDAYPNLHVRGRKSGNAGFENDAFTRMWAVGGKATTPLSTGRAQKTADGGGQANSYMKISCLEEDIDLGGATSVLSTSNLLPANSLILEIVTHPLNDLTTPTTYSVGDSSSNTRFATSLTNDNVSEGPAYCSSHWTGTVAIRQVTAGQVKLTPNAAGSGKIRVAVFYISFAGGVSR